MISTVPSLLEGIPLSIGSLSRMQSAPHWSTPYPSNSWLSFNLSTGTRDENPALSVQSPLKALHRACPIHVDSFFHAKRMECLLDPLANCSYVATLDSASRAAPSRREQRAFRITKEAARALDSRGTCSHRKNIFTLSPRLSLGRFPRPRPQAHYLSTLHPTRTPPRAERWTRPRAALPCTHASLPIGTFLHPRGSRLPRWCAGRPCCAAGARHLAASPGAPPPSGTACGVGRWPAQMGPPAGAAARLARPAACTLRRTSRLCNEPGSN